MTSMQNNIQMLDALQSVAYRKCLFIFMSYKILYDICKHLQLQSSIAIRLEKYECFQLLASTFFTLNFFIVVTSYVEARTLLVDIEHSFKIGLSTIGR